MVYVYDNRYFSLVRLSAVCTTLVFTYLVLQMSSLHRQMFGSEWFATICSSDSAGEQGLGWCVILSTSDWASYCAAGWTFAKVLMSLGFRGESGTTTCSSLVSVLWISAHVSVSILSGPGVVLVKGFLFCMTTVSRSTDPKTKRCLARSHVNCWRKCRFLFRHWPNKRATVSIKTSTATSVKWGGIRAHIENHDKFILSS